MPVRKPAPIPARDDPRIGIGRDRVPPEPERSKILAGLIQCRKDGLLQGVWCDADVIRVRYPGDLLGRPERVSWYLAADFIFRAALRREPPVRLDPAERRETKKDSRYR